MRLASFGSNTKDKTVKGSSLMSIKVLSPIAHKTNIFSMRQELNSFVFIHNFMCDCELLFLYILCMSYVVTLYLN